MGVRIIGVRVVREARRLERVAHFNENEDLWMMRVEMRAKRVIIRAVSIKTK